MKRFVIILPLAAQTNGTRSHVLVYILSTANKCHVQVQTHMLSNIPALWSAKTEGLSHFMVTKCVSQGVFPRGRAMR